MATLGPVNSLQSQPRPTPKIRRDQYRRILQIVRTNSHIPEIALSLVRDYIGSAPDVCSIGLTEDGTSIRVCLENREFISDSIRAEYQFSLLPRIVLETPTL